MLNATFDGAGCGGRVVRGGLRLDHAGESADKHQDNRRQLAGRALKLKIR